MPTNSSLKDSFTLNAGEHYLDAAATTLLPQPVREALIRAHERGGAVGRGLYPRSTESTEDYEGVRNRLADYWSVPSQEVIFTPGATYGLNLLAHLAADQITSDSVILISDREHHANLLPWYKLAEEKGAHVEVFYNFDLEPFEDWDNIAVIAVTHTSNVTGEEAPLTKLAAYRDEHWPTALLFADGSQYARKAAFQPSKAGLDGYVASSHKWYGPEGLGLVWAKSDLLTADPLTVGGGIVASMRDLIPVYLPAPHRFEAGTPNYPAVVGFGAALSWWKEHNDQAHIEECLGTLVHELNALTDLRQVGGGNGIVSYTHDTLHVHDLAEHLGRRGVAVRAGFHCAEPFHRDRDLQGTLRFSVGLWNTPEEMIEVANIVSSVILELC